MYKNEISVGRSSLNDVVIADNEVSSFHCNFVLEPDGALYIFDLDSTNGVFVNGVKVSIKKRIMPHDTIKLGNYSFDWQNAILVEPESSIEQSRDKEELPAPNRNFFTTKNILMLASAFILISALLFLAPGISDKSKELVSKITGNWSQKNNPIVYDISCLNDSTVAGSLLKSFGDLKKEVINTQDVKITIQQEEEVGVETKKQVEKEYVYSKDQAYISRVNAITTKLLKAVKNPKFNYQIHIVQSDIINAFTAGGQIFVFTGIIDFASSDDELACIIGHEIYHNELGHIADKLKEIKIAQNLLGDELGNVAYFATSLLTTSFNQENEVFCDLYGIDLAVAAGFNGCAGIDFWERMEKKEKTPQKNIFDKFSRSHPYSDERFQCNRKHIDSNYYHTCP
jgi:pSer/pThr/pTyr-binding forkhead associated (FHA) protein